MIDDKVVETAAREMRRRKFERTGVGKAFDPDIEPTENELDDARAAIAAADKVRAEGFDFEWGDETTHAYAKRAFAAGLAKGDADRAALIEALEGLYELCTVHVRVNAFTNGVTDSTGTIDEGDVKSGEYIDKARFALALVRKGE